jgi:putative ABC transport system permease protein
MGSRNPLWTKSPLLYLRFRGLMVAVVTGSFLLALAGASFPLFTSASDSSSLNEVLDGVSRYGAGISVLQDAGLRPTAKERKAGGLAFAQRDEAIKERLASVPHLGRRVLTILGPSVSLQKKEGGEQLSVRLLSKTDWEEHVLKVKVGSGPGVWLADVIADSLGVQPGDTVTLQEGRRTARVRIAGTYKALVNTPIGDPYWLSLIHQVYPPEPKEPLPPPFLLMDRKQLTHLSDELGTEGVRFDWEFPVAEGSLTIPQAKDMIGEFARFQHEFGDARSELGRKFICFSCGKIGCPSCSGATGEYSSLLSTAVATAEQNAGAIRGPAKLLSVAGIIVALTVIASAGAFAMARRRTEFSLLFARGTSPGLVAAKSAIESFIPVLVGTALGFAAAYAIISAKGPEGPIDATGLDSAMKTALLGVPAAIALLGLVGAISYLRQSESATTRFRRISRLPWEIVVLALAGFFLRKVVAGGALVEGSGDAVAHPSAYLLLFPIFFIGGCAGLMARFLRLPLRFLVGRSSKSRPSTYLALHRLAGAQMLATLLVTAAALSLGILVYSQTVAASLTTTIDAKSTLFTGSDVQASINFRRAAPHDFPYPTTKVTSLPSRATLGDTGVKADVLVVDAKSLADVVYWSDSFSDRPLEDLMAGLMRPSGDRVPVLIAGPVPDGATEMQLESLKLDLEVIDTPKYFPGATFNKPTVIVDRHVLTPLVEAGPPPNALLQIGNSTELWIKGPPEAIVAALTASSRVASTLTAEEVRANPRILAVTRTFGYLRFLGFGAGLLAVVAVLMYLQARQRNRVVSYALSRRMGLTESSHRMSLVIELLGMLLSSLGLAVLFALIAARIINSRIDPLPASPPGPLFETPWLVIAGTMAILVVVSVVGGLLANRSAERADFAEVMRRGA